MLWEYLLLGSSLSHLHSLVLHVNQVEIGGLHLCFHVYTILSFTDLSLIMNVKYSFINLGKNLKKQT